MTQRRPEWLFNSIPPNDVAYITDTFVNREKEMVIAEDYFNPRYPGKQVYAVHGFSRSGKSHLAMKFAHDISKQHNLHYFYLNANTKGGAEDVLESLFRKVREAAFEKEPGNNEILEFLQAYISKIKQLFEMPVSKLSFKTISKNARKLNSKFKARIPFVDVELGGEGGSESGEEEILELERPDIKGAREILTFLLEALVTGSEQNILVLVDDLDLLDEQHDGESERDRLTDQLKLLAELPGVAMVATTRSEYFEKRRKDFANLVYVENMGEQDLRDIYEKRIKLYNEDKAIFTKEVVDALAAGFRGMVGSFLEECDQLRREYILEVKQGETLDTHHLDKHLAKVLERLERNPETKTLFDTIRKAIEGGIAEVELPGVKKDHGLVHRLLIPMGFKQDAYLILPLFGRILKHDITGA